MVFVPSKDIEGPWAGSIQFVLFVEMV